MPSPRTPPDPGPLPSRGFTLWLTGASLVGAVIRIVQIQNVRQTCRNITTTPQTGCFRIWGDAVFGYWQGQMISHGLWWKDPLAYKLDSIRSIRESAVKPPLYPGALGALGWWGGVAPRLATIVLGLVLVAVFWAVATRRCGPLGARIVTGASVLAVVWFGLGGAVSTNEQRLALAAAGVGLIGLIGSTARSVAGERCGIIAACIAAVHPLIWINDAMLQVESMYAVAIVWVLNAALRWWRTRTMSAMTELAFAIGIAALLRPEAQLLLVAIVVPLLVRARDVAWGRRLVQFGAAALICAVAWVPWLAWNQHRFALAPLAGMTVSTGTVLSQAYCDETFYGEALGYWAAHCFVQPVKGELRSRETSDDAVDRLLRVDGLSRRLLDSGAATVSGSAVSIRLDPAVLDDSEIDAVYRAQALEYAENHLRRLPVVAVARVARTLDVFRPFDTLRLSHQVEGRPRVPSAIGLVVHWCLMVLSIVGLGVCWRRRQTIVPYVGTIATVLITTGLTFGVVRYRIPIDLVEVILGSVAIDALLGRRRRHLASEPTTFDHDGVSP